MRHLRARSSEIASTRLSLRVLVGADCLVCLWRYSIRSLCDVCYVLLLVLLPTVVLKFFKPTEVPALNKT